MVWNKVKQQLETFITPSLVGVVEYRASGYRYSKEKAANCYLTVNKVEVFNQKDCQAGISWYQTEQDVKNDERVNIYVTAEEIDEVRQKSGNKIPEERLEVIAKGHKLNRYAKEVLHAQQELYKTDFQKASNGFLTTSIDLCLESDDIILNVLAIIDRRVGKKRLTKMADIMKMKHPVVQYFYELRLNS